MKQLRQAVINGPNTHPGLEGEGEREREGGREGGREERREGGWVKDRSVRRRRMSKKRRRRRRKRKRNVKQLRQAVINGPNTHPGLEGEGEREREGGRKGGREGG